MKTPPIYAIPGTDANMAAVRKHCMKNCEYGLNMGLMIIARYPSYTCSHSDCQYIETEVDLAGTSGMTGRKVIGRKVRL
jgi:hypothetical protein